MKTVEQLIERHAEINAMNEFFPLGDGLRIERQAIVDCLIEKGVIALTVGDQGGFHFIGEDAEKNKAWYFECSEGF